VVYLIQPHGPLLWNSVSDRMTFGAVREHGADLAQLDWEPSELPFTPDMLRVALRHGVACSAGLVLGDGEVARLGRPGELRGIIASSPQRRQGLASADAVMERVDPGWMERQRELDAGVNESVEQQAQQADRDVAGLLAAPVQPDLVEHWRSLGGRLPEPL